MNCSILTDKEQLVKDVAVPARDKYFGILEKIAKVNPFAFILSLGFKQLFFEGEWEQRSLRRFRSHLGRSPHCRSCFRSHQAHSWLPRWIPRCTRYCEKD